jgi:hypothetical protein
MDTALAGNVEDVVVATVFVVLGPAAPARAAPAEHPASATESASAQAYSLQ